MILHYHYQEATLLRVEFEAVKSELDDLQASSNELADELAAAEARADDAEDAAAAAVASAAAAHAEADAAVAAAAEGSGGGGDVTVVSRSADAEALEEMGVENDELEAQVRRPSSFSSSFPPRL